MKKFQISRGFTLIELLVVMAVMAILSIGLLAAIDPLDKIKAAGDTRVTSDVGVLARAIESFASNQGYYPSALSSIVLPAFQELKSIPVPPAGQCGATTALNAYDVGTECDLIEVPTDCSTGQKDCTSVIIVARLKSKKYPSLSWWRYESSTGKSCVVTVGGFAAAKTTAC